MTTQFGFIDAEETLHVTIRGKTYPVIKAGKGIPCFLICLGTPTFRTLSKNFAEHFEIYSSDVYWIETATLDDPTSLSMDMIIDDIKAFADALNIHQYVIFGHSAYGIVALEFAKKYPNDAQAIVMVGTPVNSNSSVGEINNQIFHNTADAKRKLIDAQRRAEVAKEDLSSHTIVQRWDREYIYRDAPRYWHIPDFDCTTLWEGVPVNSVLMRLFSDVLPATNVLRDLEKISLPIFLAAGVSDFDCCPWMWREVKNLPKDFTVSVFQHSGHWPHYEEAQLFDERVLEWLRERRVS